MRIKGGSSLTGSAQKKNERGHPVPLRLIGFGRGVLLSLTVMVAVGGCACKGTIKTPEDRVALHQPGDAELTCQQLDSELYRLYRKARQLAPGTFSEDRGNTAAAVVGSIAFAPAYLYIVQNELGDKPEQRRRIAAIMERIELLRRYKAEKHCYETR